ncbi:SRPBCC family protein [Bosea vaviloviae]|uniref:Vanillate O-demethylase oxidoreductase VanB n=1 Tax=Bosea vaviloviae TaxID=1526658 RepID=A0A1D7U7K7_9HYPH|nr:SRPBCC family protein [Bosea vaviloviae]AOO83365.1 vanillate O-demethylase oxidoreductase VanB [Bosea vaviloviae]
MSDCIEKKVHLRAPLDRVWQAIADSSQFGIWFGVVFDGPFVAGSRLVGRITPTQVDPEVAAMQKPYEGKTFTFIVDRVEPMRMIAFRWHPYAVDSNVDYDSEPMTLVTFDLAEVADGVLLTISESGFDAIPLSRRAEAFTANDGGWTKQAELIKKYLVGTSAS